MRVILLDIEGTTTPINFVHQTLFPFARKRMRDFVSENFANIQDEIALLYTEYMRQRSEGLLPPLFDRSSVESVTEYLNYLIDNDSKATALKSLQGRIWQVGYKSGELLGEVFDDVLPAFERWKNEGKTIAVFSSGSILAQKLIFGFSTAGDLTHYISAYFDTTTGGKDDPESYQKIAEGLKFPSVEILFLSDIVAELTAASAAGMNCKISVRPNNPPITAHSKFEFFRSFNEI